MQIARPTIDHEDAIREARCEALRRHGGSKHIWTRRSNVRTALSSMMTAKPMGPYASSSGCAGCCRSDRPLARRSC